jgi:hypothetical protein
MRSASFRILHECFRAAAVVLIYLPYLLVVGYAYVTLVHVLRFAVLSYGLITGEQHAFYRAA